MITTNHAIQSGAINQSNRNYFFCGQLQSHLPKVMPAKLNRLLAVITFCF